MSLLAVPLMAFVSLVMCFVLFLWLLISNKKNKQHIELLNAQLSSATLLIDDLQSKLNQESESVSSQLLQAKQDILENGQVAKQLEHRIKTLQEKLQSTNDLIESIEQKQPEDKLYSRASKLVALGADVEEIMRDCDIPRAEAEMLIAVHAKK